MKLTAALHQIPWFRMPLQQKSNLKQTGAMNRHRQRWNSLGMLSHWIWHSPHCIFLSTISGCCTDLHFIMVHYTTLG